MSTDVNLAQCLPNLITLAGIYVFNQQSIERDQKRDSENDARGLTTSVRPTEFKTLILFFVDKTASKFITFSIIVIIYY